MRNFSKYDPSGTARAQPEQWKQQQATLTMEVIAEETAYSKHSV